MRRATFILLYLVGQQLLPNDLISHFEQTKPLSNDKVLQVADSIIQSESDDYLLLAHAHYQKGYLYLRSYKKVNATRHYLKADEYLHKSKREYLILYHHIWKDLGFLQKRALNNQVSIEYYKKALGAAIELERKDLQASLYYDLYTPLKYENIEEAYESVFKSLDLAEELAHSSNQKRRDYSQRILHKIYNRLGGIYAQNNEFERANGMLNQAMSFATSDLQRGNVLGTFGLLSFYKKDLEAQEQYYIESLKLLEGASRFNTLKDLGENLKLRGKNEEAKGVLKEAEELLIAHNLLSFKNAKIYDWMLELDESIEYQVGVLIRHKEVLKQINVEMEELRILSEQAGITLAIRSQEEHIGATREKETLTSKIWWGSICGGTIIFICLVVWWDNNRKTIKARQILSE